MSGIYIHIPFCSRRCSYCDFFFTTNRNLIPEFLSALATEICLVSDRLKGYSFDTIFFGGGTPSLLKETDLAHIMDVLNKYLGISPGAEISLEANPEDIDLRKLNEFRNCGVNRLSLGIQSFNDDELRFLTRSHDSGKAEESVRMATGNMDNVNADIIYSLPSQQEDNVAQNIQKAAALGVNHISAYTLTFEPGTLLFKSEKQGKVRRNNTDAEAELYRQVCESSSSAGFQQYEVSNFARPGFKCRHNLKYWTLKEYIGFGPSAHSFIGNERWNNVTGIGAYCGKLDSNILPSENRHRLSEEELKSDFIMLGLRAEGIPLGEYTGRFNHDFAGEYRNSVSLLEEKGLAVIADNVFRLTGAGYLLADEIISRYF